MRTDAIMSPDINKNNNTTKPEQEPKKFRMPWWTLAFLALLLSPLLVKTFIGTPKEINWQEFRQNILPKNAAEKIVIINDEYAQIFLKDSLAKDTAFRDVVKSSGKLQPGPQYLMTIGSIESFERKLE